MSVNRAALLTAVVAAENAADGAYARLVFALSVTVADVAGLVKELVAVAMTDPDAEGRIAARLMAEDPESHVPYVSDSVCEPDTCDVCPRDPGACPAATLRAALTALLAGEYADADVSEATARVRHGYACKFRNGLNRALGKTPMNTTPGDPMAALIKAAEKVVKAGGDREAAFAAVAGVLGLSVIPGTVVTSDAGMPTRAPEAPSKGRARIRGTKSPRVVS